MHVVGEQFLGLLILLLLAALVIIKRLATGSIFEKPNPVPLLWLVNLFNLFFLLIANPLAGILLLVGRLRDVDPTFINIGTPWLLIALEIVGLMIYLAGFSLMGWALLKLGGNYQLGGSDPRSTDRLVLDGPYALVRHPMYTAALCIAFGLTCLIQSLACFVASFVYLALILLLIPVEEASLQRAYGSGYALYQRNVRKLVPFVY